MDEDKFQGGGTPIGSIIPQQRPPQYQPQPQPQQQPQQQPQYPQQQPQYPQPQYPQRVQQQKVQVSSETNFEKTLSLSPLQFGILVLLIIIVNSPITLSLTKNYIPQSLRRYDPPFLLIIINALVITLAYAGINKYISG